MNDEKRTPEETAAFGSLPKEMTPGRLLEERVVRSLRAEGILREKRREGFLLTPRRSAVAAAALLLVAIGCYAAGEKAGTRRAMEVASVVREGDGRALAALVQETGSAYVQALGLLAAAGAADPAAYGQGREVAVAALYAASRQVVGLAPDEPVARGILGAIVGTGTPSPEDSTGRDLVWF